MMGLYSTFQQVRASLVVAVLAALALAACGPRNAAGPVVLAPSSMQEALGGVADEWERQGHARPVLSFAATNALARQVERGAPADIVICADEEWMDWLAQRHLVREATRRVIAGNAIVLVSSTKEGAFRSNEDRLRGIGDGRLALADPASVPAGRYARAALENMGLWEEMQDRIVPAENVRAALALVEAGEARLGIVYATDAMASRKVHDARRFSIRGVPEILYPAARTANADHRDGEGFLAFLSGPQAQAIFADHGFLPHEPAP